MKVARKDWQSGYTCQSDMYRVTKQPDIEMLHPAHKELRELSQKFNSAFKGSSYVCHVLRTYQIFHWKGCVVSKLIEDYQKITVMSILPQTTNNYVDTASRNGG